MGSLQELSIRLSTLAVFRELQEDAVINSLRKYLAEPSPALYALFVSALYRANGGILGAYVREICENSENVYVQAVGKKEEIPAYLREAVLEELKTLQMTAELTPETLRSAMEYRAFYPALSAKRRTLKRATQSALRTSASTATAFTPKTVCSTLARMRDRAGQ